jgi:DNA-binding transcriptional MerR regulator
MAVFMDEKRFSLDELCALTKLKPRTVRFYIQMGLVDRPVGETRAAYYTAKHAEQLAEILKWSEAGLSLERIRELLKGADAPVPAPARKPGSVEVWSHLVVSEGVELHLEPGRAGMSPGQVRAFFREVMAAYRRIAKDGSNED